MPTVWEQVRFVTHLIRLMRDPSDLDQIRSLGEVATNLADPAPALRAVAYAMRDPGYRDLYERSYHPRFPSLARLRQLSPGTLGRAYAEHMLGAGLSPDFMRECRASDARLAFLSDRIFRTHDVAHVLTGIDTSERGEVLLQAFCFGQLSSGVHLGIVLAGLFQTLRTDHDNIQPLFDDITRAYLSGRSARFLLGVAWDEHWARPLLETRELMRLGAGGVCETERAG